MGMGRNKLRGSNRRNERLARGNDRKEKRRKKSALYKKEKCYFIRWKNTWNIK
jgi:hypothetical protein